MEFEIIFSRLEDELPFRYHVKTDGIVRGILSSLVEGKGAAALEALHSIADPKLFPAEEKRTLFYRLLLVAFCSIYQDRNKAGIAAALGQMLLLEIEMLNIVCREAAECVFPGEGVGFQSLREGLVTRMLSEYQTLIDAATRTALNLGQPIAILFV